MRLSPGDRVRARFASAWEEGGPAPGLGGAVLSPAAVFYGLAIRMYHAAYDAGLFPVRGLGVPVISVGNITVGGAGKTPVTRWVVDRLLDRGRRPGVLHGGYHDDEPALHRLWHPSIPVVAMKDRAAGGSRAVAAGADILVLDDAFQHRRLARDLDMVLVAAELWSDHPALLPRGPWREPPAALRRAGLLCVTRKTAAPDRAADVATAVARAAPGVPVAQMHLHGAGWTNGAGARRTAPPPTAAVAVAGIAGPTAFLDQARGAGAELADVVVLPDHYDYGPDAMGRILARAGERPIVTTAKDAVKLLRDLSPDRLWVLEQGVTVERGEDLVKDALDALPA